MNKFFIVCGYGVPRDILADANYQRYLNFVFNRIYDAASEDSSIGVVFSGGPTDCFPPYKRTEAGEMLRFFKVLAKRPLLKGATEHWQLWQEKESLSSLENLVNSLSFLKKKKLKPRQVVVFCEATRMKRLKDLVRLVFAKTGIRAVVEPIDFDTSANRYLPAAYLLKKEKEELAEAKWALRSAGNYKKFKDVFKRKMDFVRKNIKNPELMKLWWKERNRLMKSYGYK